ncbi:MAG: chromosome partitioning protein [Bacteroidota bacterium]|nr:chromosome partitioning protein [Bacteroidota bacterium]
MILMPFNPDVFAPEGINLMLEGLLQRIKPWPNPRIAAFMNKAKTIRDFYLTGDSQKYLNKVKQSKAKIEQRGIKIHVLDSFIPEKINIKSSLQKEKFPSEIEPYIQRLWNDINALLEARHE